ncbi:DUF3299 domain-containing protein [Vibrio algicola]
MSESVNPPLKWWQQRSDTLKVIVVFSCLGIMLWSPISHAISKYSGVDTSTPQATSKSVTDIKSSAKKALDISGKKVVSLEWEDLVPADEKRHFNSVGMPIAPNVTNHNGPAAKQSHIGKTRPELDGKIVKIPGFVIPLEGDANTVTEFLLVPYFGACIHVPPPPPNQIIYVKFPQGAPVQKLWDVVYVVGKLQTQVLNHELAETGYTMQGAKIEKYDDGNY